MEYKNIKWLPMPHQVEKNKNDIESLDKRVRGIQEDFNELDLDDLIIIPNIVEAVHRTFKEVFIDVKIEFETLESLTVELLDGRNFVEGTIFEVSATVDNGDNINGNSIYIASLNTIVKVMNKKVFVVFDKIPTQDLFITIAVKEPNEVI